jgi:hypothetical protein
MQEIELPDLPPKTEQERLEEQARDELGHQLNESNRLVLEAKNKLAQAEKKEADARALRAQADLKVSEAKSKVERLELQTDFEATLETERSEREKERLEHQEKEEQRERERLEHQAKEEQRERRLQEMEARLEALVSANGEPSQANREFRLANDAFLNLSINQRSDNCFDIATFQYCSIYDTLPHPDPDAIHASRNAISRRSNCGPKIIDTV